MQQNNGVDTMSVCSKKGKVMGTALFAIGLLDLIYLVVVYLLGAGLHPGVLFLAFWGICFMLLGGIRAGGKKKFWGVNAINIKRVILTITIITLIPFIPIESLIILSSRADDLKQVSSQADYILVLGAGLKGDIVMPVLKTRLDKALQYMQTHPGKKAVLSGGKGKGEAMPEAEAMRRYLVERGIDERDIIVENRSTSTYENLKYTKKILSQFDSRQKINILIITSDFHLFRARFLAVREGFQAYGIPSKTPVLDIPHSYAREFFAVIKSYVFDRK